MRLLVGSIVSWLFVAAAYAAPAHEWPQYRGPGSTGASAQSGVFEAPAGVGLSVAWKQPLGSGYSGIVVAGGRAVTMFTDGKSDVLVAFDDRSGRELWRHAQAGTELGHDGSHDGPLSTPLIAGERVIGLGTQGALFAVEAATGKPIWSVDLVETFAAQKPYFGFTTSPILAGDTVVVLVGGENAAVVGLDPATGTKKWSTGTDQVQFQTPAVIEHEGKPVVLAAGMTKLFAIDPASGKLLWEYAHEGGGNGYGAPSLTPVPMGDGRLLLTHEDDGSKAVRFTTAGDATEFETLWENNAIRGSYNVPVYHDGHVYAYSARFLTCVDAQTGEVRWRSREPGDGFLVLVDRHLVIVTKTGGVHVVKASPEAFEPVAGLGVFDDHAWSAPSFANGNVFVRSLDEIARIDVGRGAKLARHKDDPKEVLAGTTFGQFVDRLEALPNRRAVVNRYIGKVESFPIVEDDVVIFVYDGRAEDVAVASELLGVSQERPMHRVPGTDLFWYALRLDRDARANYLLIRDYEPMLDPLNPRKTETTLLGEDMEFSFSGEAMEMSWFAMPGWQEPAWLAEPDPAREGRLESHELEGAALPAKLRVDVYLPAGYAEGDTRYPVAFVHGGAPNALERGRWRTALDNLVGRQVEPLIVVFVGTAGVQVPQYVEYFSNELVPWVDATYRTIARPAQRANIGMGNGGIAAFYCTFMRPGLVGKLGTQSAWLFEFAWSGIEPLVKDAREQPLDVYLDWGTWDLHNPVENWHVGRLNAEAADFLRERGYWPSGGEVHDGSGWSSWSTRTDALLGSLFPLADAPPVSESTGTGTTGG